METEVQKNTADIAILDKRMSSHEAMCEERWKTCFNRFDDVDSSISRIETILISSAGAIIVGAVTLIFTLWQVMQEKHMEMEYNKKDIAKSPKMKKYSMDELFIKRGVWYAVKNEEKLKFDSKEEAVAWLEK